MTEVVDCCRNFKKGTQLLRHVSTFCRGSIFNLYRCPSLFRLLKSIREKSEEQSWLKSLNALDSSRYWRRGGFDPM